MLDRSFIKYSVCVTVARLFENFVDVTVNRCKIKRPLLFSLL